MAIPLCGNVLLYFVVTPLAIPPSKTLLLLLCVLNKQLNGGKFKFWFHNDDHAIIPTTIKRSFDQIIQLNVRLFTVKLAIVN